MKLPLRVDLTGKVAVVTGAGGVLCGMFSKALASAGAKVAVLDLNEAAAQAVAQAIRDDGGAALAYSCNVLDRDSLQSCHQAVLRDLGPCDVLINGAGGNNPRATTDKEYFEPGDMDSDTKSFFNLDQKGVELVFNLNFIGTLLPTQTFARDMMGRDGCSILNISSMNAYTPLTKIPAYSGAKAAISNFTQWLAVHFSKVGIRVNAIAPGFLWAALASRRNCWVLCCSSWTTVPPPLSPASSFRWTAASPPTPAYKNPRFFTILGKIYVMRSIL